MKRRRAATSPDCSSPLFKRYKRDWLPEQGEALGVIRGWIESGDRVALTCYEHLPEQCHGHCMAEALESQLGAPPRTCEGGEAPATCTLTTRAPGGDTESPARATSIPSNFWQIPCSRDARPASPPAIPASSAPIPSSPHAIPNKTQPCPLSRRVCPLGIDLLELGIELFEVGIDRAELGIDRAELAPARSAPQNTEPRRVTQLPVCGWWIRESASSCSSSPSQRRRSEPGWTWGSDIGRGPGGGG